MCKSNDLELFHESVSAGKVAGLEGQSILDIPDRYVSSLQRTGWNQGWDTGHKQRCDNTERVLKRLVCRFYSGQVLKTQGYYYIDGIRITNPQTIQAINMARAWFSWQVLPETEDDEAS